MKRVVKILNAKNVNSHFGIVIDEDENMVLLKVAYKSDRNPAFNNFLVLGKNLIQEM